MTSNAIRWSVRKSSPIDAGEPNERSIEAECESEPPVERPIATITSTRIAPPARHAATTCHDGPPAHGASPICSPR